MALVQLIYASARTEKLGPEDIQSILGAAQRRNAALGVTGVLFFHADYFLQCLEGDRANVNALYARILRDERHTFSQLLRFQDAVQRDFSAWAMGYLGEYSKTTEAIRRFSAQFKFSPFEMSGEGALELLKTLRDGLPTS